MSLKILSANIKSMSKIALITGITGQDGAYLAQYLLEKIILYWSI